MIHKIIHKIRAVKSGRKRLKDRLLREEKIPCNEIQNTL